MEELQFIVSRLNEAPFSINLTLVEFDEKSPIETLEILNNILATIEPEMEVDDIRNESEEGLAVRITQFLVILKCKLIPSINGNDPTNRQQWMRELSQGNKKVILPIMHWLLSSHNTLCKRAYLARFLVPIDLPTEIKMQCNNDLKSLIEEYTKMQDEFKRVHQKHEKVVSSQSESQQSELKVEIKQLHNEKQELQDKIKSFETKTKNDRNIEKLLDTTKQLRLEQEKEIQLIRRKKEQNQLLYLADQKLSTMKQRLIEFRRNFSEETNSNNILNAVIKEIQDTKKTVRTDMVAEITKMEGHLAELMKERLEPTLTENDVERIRSEVVELQEENKRLTNLMETKSNDGMDKIAMFRQHVNLSADRLLAKKREVEANKKDLYSIQKEVDELEAKSNQKLIAACSKLRPNGVVMSEDDIKLYGSRLRKRIKQYNDAKDELSELQAENVTLNMTEQTLRKRNSRIEDFLKQQEQSAGLEGFRDTQEKLENDSEKVADVDDIKGQTLEEISALIKDMTMKLEGKKEHLKPLISALKEKRDGFRDIKQQHQEKKSRYDKIALKIARERQLLEKKCDTLQSEWLDEERKYYQLCAMNSLVKSRVDRTQMEEEWKSGKKNFLPEFKCIQDLYENKIQQQENLAKQLRKQQRSIKENEESHIYQRRLFADLQHLLAYKSEVNERNKNVFKTDEQLIADTVDVGNAQVLCLE